MTAALATHELNTRGLDLMRAGEYVQAAYFLRRALDHTPDDPHSLNNLASTLKQLGREDESIAIYEKLMQTNPGFMAAVNNLAFSYLRNGRYREGWELYGHRLQANAKLHNSINPLTKKPFWQEPRITLDDLRGKTVLLVPEQGIGDELFFLRFVNELYRSLSQDCAVFYAPSVKAYPFLKTKLDGMCDQSFSGVPKHNAVAVPLADLPHLCGHDGTWFPDPLRLDFGSEPPVEPSEEIGVTWRAGNQDLVHRGGCARSIDPFALGRALRSAPYNITVIQRGVTDQELERFKAGLGGDHFGGDHFDVYTAPTSPRDELLGICERLSRLTHYVGVSNTNTHLLAGIGGVQQHVLVPIPGEYLYPNTHGSETPWFPGVEVYRQTVADGWEGALAKLSEGLSK